MLICFNSNVVRLKGDSLRGAVGTYLFQFQCGTIKRRNTNQAEHKYEQSFNSNVVRLKAVRNHTGTG